MAKLECRETRPVCAPFHITELVQQVVQKFELAAQQRGVVLGARVISPLPAVYADSGMIERVLVNLVDNALRFTRVGGSVTVFMVKASDRISVSVADTGCGIASAALPQLFNGRPPSDFSNSRGLGLTIAKRILALHNTEIGVQSATEVGTRFYFSLPIAAAQNAATEQALCATVS